MKVTALSLYAYLVYIAFVFIQVGASLFATTVNVATLIKEPPKSLFILQGEYTFNPDVFWNTFPTISLVVFVITLIICWKTPLGKWLLIGWLVGIAAAVVAIFLLGPVQSEFLTTPYTDTFDPNLQKLGSIWFNYSVLFMCISALSGLIMIYGITLNFNLNTKASNLNKKK